MTSSPSSPVVPAPAAVSRLPVLHDDAALNALALESGFIKRQPRKITPKVILHSFLQAACSQRCSTRQLAFITGLHLEDTVARQSLWERITEGASSFFASVLAKCLHTTTQAASLSLPGVSRILVQDSSILPLDPSLKEAFPGSSNQKVSTAAARLQFTFDLLSGHLIDTALHSFTDVDQGAAKDILTCLKPGDLVMRDLGYYSLAAMAGIAEKEAFFLTRLRYGTVLHDAEGVQMDLLKELRRRCSSGAPLVMEVQVGAKQKVPMRLIAVPLPQALADERRRRARKDRDARLRHSENYYALLSWTLLLTNLPAASLPAGKMQALYAMRWRIENIFRAWKGNLKPAMTSQHRSNEHHLRCLLHAQQILLAMAAQQMLMAVATGGSGAPEGKKKRPGKSLFKLMDLMLIIGGLGGVIKNLPHEHPVVQRLLDYHGRYDSRKRLTLPELIAQCLS